MAPHNTAVITNKTPVILKSSGDSLPNKIQHKKKRIFWIPASTVGRDQCLYCLNEYVETCVYIFICSYLGAVAGHGAVAVSSSGAGPPPAGLPEDHL